MLPREVLQKYFGYNTFRPAQENIIQAIQDGRKVLAIMPTGAGKSICFQVPALLFPYGTIVISPLISLMKDQVETLVAQGIPASFVNSTISYEESIERLRDLYRGKIKILYMAPERLMAPYFVSCLEKVPLSMVVIDEAHCVSQWGHDFRPSYSLIKGVIDRLSSEPVITAFTATATTLVEEDMKMLLGLTDAMVFRIGLDRPNLSFRVFRHVDKENFIFSYTKSHQKESGIIYCATRKSVDEIYEHLQREGISAGRYHAGMTDKERQLAQDDFSYDRIQVMVATNAFGMGIDKSNVRYVIHYQMPKSLEAYYQEAGRAGRDGAKAECILLYSGADSEIQRYLIEISDKPEEQRHHDYERLHAMEKYAQTSQCLRNTILDYFGEKENSPCGHCGNCENESCRVDITDMAQLVFRTVAAVKGHFGASVIAQILKGSQRKMVMAKHLDQVLTFGKLQSAKLMHIRDLITSLMADGYLDKDKEFGTIELTPLAKAVLAGQKKVRGMAVGFYELVADDISEANSSAPDRSLFDQLRELRAIIAKEEHVPPFVVFSDATLEDMIRLSPKNQEEMAKVHGVGAFKLQKYGTRFLDILHQNQKVTVSDERITNEALLKRLYTLRRRICEERKVAARQIFTDAMLEQMAEMRPMTLKELKEIKGIGERKAQQYGLLFLPILQGKKATIKDIQEAPVEGDIAEKAYILYLQKVRQQIAVRNGKKDEDILSDDALRMMAREKKIPVNFPHEYGEKFRNAIMVYEEIIKKKI